MNIPHPKKPNPKNAREVEASPRFFFALTPGPSLPREGSFLG